MEYQTLKQIYSIAQKDYIRLVQLPSGDYQVLADNTQSGQKDLVLTKPSQDLESQKRVFYIHVNSI